MTRYMCAWFMGLGYNLSTCRAAVPAGLIDGDNEDPRGCTRGWYSRIQEPLLGSVTSLRTFQAELSVMREGGVCILSPRKALLKIVVGEGGWLRQQGDFLVTVCYHVLMGIICAA